MTKDHFEKCLRKKLPPQDEIAPLVLALLLLLEMLMVGVGDTVRVGGYCDGTPVPQRELEGTKNGVTIVS